MVEVSDKPKKPRHKFGKGMTNPQHRRLMEKLASLPEPVGPLTAEQIKAQKALDSAAKKREK